MTVFHIILYQIEVKIGEFRWFCLYQFDYAFYENYHPIQ